MANATEPTPALGELPAEAAPWLRELLEAIILTLDIRENRAARNSGRAFVSVDHLGECDFAHEALPANHTVTQLTSKATAVTLNRLKGRVTLNNAALAAGEEVSFTVNNSLVKADDLIVVNHTSAGTGGSYIVQAHSLAQGSFAIVVCNLSAGSLSEAIVLTFAVLKRYGSLVRQS